MNEGKNRIHSFQQKKTMKIIKYFFLYSEILKYYYSIITMVINNNDNIFLVIIQSEREREVCNYKITISRRNSNPVLSAVIIFFLLTTK